MNNKTDERIKMLSEEKSNLPIPRNRLVDMVVTWNECTSRISTAFLMVDESINRLDTVFGGSGHWIHIDRHSLDWKRPDFQIQEMKKHAWAALINNMGLRQILSIKAAKELDEQIRTGKDIPEFTEETLLGLLQGTLDRTSEFVKEAVHEVFEWLRPHHDRYKTNTQFEVGEKVVLEWAVEKPWSLHGNYRVGYSREQNFRALDNVFHMLDGKGAIKTHGGPLCDAINTTPFLKGNGETEYFAFKCFKNQNLHLRFKRMDLVASLNAVAGGNRLKPKMEETK